jgi:hypothetical protein
MAAGNPGRSHVGRHYGHFLHRPTPRQEKSFRVFPLFFLLCALFRYTLPGRTFPSPRGGFTLCPPSYRLLPFRPSHHACSTSSLSARTHFGQDGPAERYVNWTRRLVLFHDKRHPRDLSPGNVARFLEHLAQTEKDPLTSVEQAHAAVTFLYKDVLGLAIDELPFPEPPRLLDRLRRACRVRQFSRRTENCYAKWAERYIRFHGLRHPKHHGCAGD